MNARKVLGIMLMLIMPLSSVSVLSSCSSDDEDSVTEGDSGKETAKVKAVDLGLSVKWANMNVGATSPEDCGDYFAWGETEPKPTAMYNYSTYKLCNGEFNKLTKYCTNSNYGTVDNKTTLDPEDDAAHVNMGGAWRMPTSEELAELINQCTWTWTVQNEVGGYKITSKTNGNYIFMPATGCCDTEGLYGTRSYGYYWSSSLLDSKNAYNYCFWHEQYSKLSHSSRAYGLSVRAVCP